MKPVLQRELVKKLALVFEVSERRACCVLQVSRSSHRYQSVRGDQAFLVKRMKEIASIRVRCEFAQMNKEPLAELSDKLARGVGSLENWSSKLEYIEGKLCLGKQDHSEPKKADFSSFVWT